MLADIKITINHKKPKSSEFSCSRVLGGVWIGGLRLMMENFTGCRVLSSCIMCNHFQLLLEVTLRPQAALTDEELLKRLGGYGARGT
jgi:hypothetical protein